MSVALGTINEHSAASNPLAALSPETLHEALTVAVLRFVVLSLGQARGLFTRDADFQPGRLFRGSYPQLDVRASVVEGQLVWSFSELLGLAAPAFRAELELGLRADGVDFASCPVELVGNLYELLLAERVQRNECGAFELVSGKRRKQTGTFFTPRALTEIVVARALEPHERRIRDSTHSHQDFVSGFRVCDPAVGGGAFLVEVARALSTRSSSGSLSERRLLATDVLCGVDINPMAVAVAEAALCLFVADPDFPLAAAGKNLHVGDALLGPPYRALSTKHARRLGDLAEKFDFLSAFPEVFERGGFDLVIGNPPWVAYAGRAAQPLPPSRKAYLAAHYDTLKGYPTLHGLFVERALRLAPRGTIALVVPSPIADLHGYRAVRRAVRETHTPCEPLLEFGQDAFASVTQPCFALIAEASAGNVVFSAESDAPLRLAERQRAGATAAEVSAPSALIALTQGPTFPRELFGEMGFQTTSHVTQNLLLRAPSPDAIHHYPLLEGRDVHEFAQREPQLFLAPDRAALSKARCRLRDSNEYRRVSFVVRQTARYPIAARHTGLPFRNSLLAGFEVEGLPPDLVVGLLNSSLYRALHLALRRDARQATFPQVKIAHLRALPEPPLDLNGRALIAGLSAELTRDGVDRARVQLLDAAVFALFSFDSQAAREVLEFLGARAAPSLRVSS
ncbi:MAG TPA: N-6 DNA methylase [Polyangiaceae bacterium]|nr:N-6 DNA methylase [Polyangiaceae bacterium]